MGDKPKLLLHSCCGPCSTAVIERLAEKYDITLFFYNPNITDPGEYEKRKSAQLQFIQRYNQERPTEEPVKFLEGNYDVNRFYEVAKGLESEPEGGKRCEKCIELRLGETAEQAAGLSFDCFGTTLSVSPHKNYMLISQIGCGLASRVNIEYVDEDFKKKDGFQRSIELAKKYELYRQYYCGCEYSKQKKR